MKTQANRSKRNRKFYQIMFAAFVFLCAVIGFLCFQYYLHLQSTIKAESRGYMQEISSQMGTNINKTIEDKYAVLGTMATVLDHLQVDSYSQLETVLEEQQPLWHYQELLLIDKNGTAYDVQGNLVALSNDTYLQDVVVHKQAAMSPSQVIDGKESIIFAIPLQNVRIDGIEMLGLAAGYELRTFDQILSMEAFEGKGYAHIIHNDGTAIVRSSSPNALQTGYNILNSLADATFNDGKSIASIAAEIADGKNGQTEFTLGNTHEYMTYSPLGAQQWSLLTFVPVEVVNAKSSLLLKITLLLCGFITLVFSLLLGVLFFTSFRNKRKLEQLAYVDSVTGGNTIECFYELAQPILAASEKTQYALIYTNVEKFKVLNEQFGQEACDEILRSINYGIESDLQENECMGRLFADNFCVLIQYNDEESLSLRLEQWYQSGANYMESGGILRLPLMIEFGVYIIRNTAMPFPHMIDRAKLSLSETVSEFHGKIRYVIYNEQIRRILFREKQLEDWMETALSNHEFQTYLQPKYCTQTETVGGAEALVRWVSPVEGMIFPDEFIPIFEKNGFVIQLDYYVFEEVCKTIRKWLDLKVTPIKISVNCSRLHLRDVDFLKKYSAIADRYQVPHQLLEIELTENVVFEDVEHLSGIIKAIQAAGFGCSMDDFGSGYSSLNLIQDIPVDTLKLDKILFRNTKNLQRSESVIGSILSMASALSMKTVAEGVEERTQVDMLKRLHCDYIQGYFFAKPMPISAFELLAFGEQLSDLKDDSNIAQKGAVQQI